MLGSVVVSLWLIFQLRNLGPATVNARVRVEFPTHLQGKFLLYVFANASEESLTCHTNSADIDSYNVRISCPFRESF